MFVADCRPIETTAEPFLSPQITHRLSTECSKNKLDFIYSSLFSGNVDCKYLRNVILVYEKYK